MCNKWLNQDTFHWLTGSLIQRSIFDHFFPLLPSYIFPVRTYPFLLSVSLRELQRADSFLPTKTPGNKYLLVQLCLAQRPFLQGCHSARGTTSLPHTHRALGRVISQQPAPPEASMNAHPTALMLWCSPSGWRLLNVTACVTGLQHLLGGTGLPFRKTRINWWMCSCTNPSAAHLSIREEPLLGLVVWKPPCWAWIGPNIWERNFSCNKRCTA